jgi:hypothetical protein
MNPVNFVDYFLQSQVLHGFLRSPTVPELSFQRNTVNSVEPIEATIAGKTENPGRRYGIQTKNT